MSGSNVDKARLATRWQQRIDSWMSRRAPRAKRVQLSNKNIYILPSRQGWLLCAVLVVMLLAAINYQNSLLFGLCFWIGSTFAMVIWHTWKNLAQLQLEAMPLVSGFSGERVPVPLKLTAKSQSHLRLEISWRSLEGEDVVPAPVIVNLASESSETLSLPFEHASRGYAVTPRIVIASVYPLGILRAWSIIDLDQPVLLYPKPVYGVAPNEQAFIDDSEATDDNEPQKPETGGSDFYEINPYRRGDSLNRIDWKRLAKTGEKVTKNFASQSTRAERELNYERFSHLPVEQAVSAMTGWVVEWSKAGLPFKFQLGELTIEYVEGENSAEVIQCLTALALYGLVSSDSEFTT